MVASLHARWDFYRRNPTSPIATLLASRPGGRPGWAAMRRDVTLRSQRGKRVPSDPAVSPRFVTGSLMRHVIVMAATGAVGLIAIFAVDLLNLFYISLLGQHAIAAAIGFAGTVTFFQTSLSIGMTIGVGAVVSRHIGAGSTDIARRVSTASLAIMIVVLAVVGVGTVAVLAPILAALGATGETRDLAIGYVSITSPSLPLLAIGMCCSALLRSVGDAKRAMNVTLIGACVTAALDPLLILALHLDLEGAAISTICSRLTIAFLGWRGAARHHRLLGQLHPRTLLSDAHDMLRVAAPAIMTNLATPVGSAYVTRVMSQFGSDAIAGQATIDRLSPVAFGLIYALTGAIGPIIAQNLGAGLVQRIREALRDSLLVVVATVVIAWVILALGQNYVVMAFSAKGVAADLIRLFCSWVALGFLFTGSLYVANAAFNNLGFPYLSLLFNWGRATLGVIPFVSYGAMYGPQGVLVGQAAGSLVFGVVAVITAFRVVGRIGGVARPHMQVAVPNAATGGAALAAFASRAQTHH
jgi:Na+-driven multidrug efflux pump